MAWYKLFLVFYLLMLKYGKKVIKVNQVFQLYITPLYILVVKMKALFGLGCGLKGRKGTGNYCKAQHVYVPIYYTVCMIL